MSLPNFETLAVEVSGAIGTLTLTRPKALNALNKQMLGELQRALDGLAKDAGLRCLILTGAGEKAFVAGADIAEMASMSASEAEAFARLGHEVFMAVERFPTPVLGAVNGYALGGGCELALACDILYASDRAKLGQPEVKLGLIPGFGGTVRLARKVGLAAASEWIYTGEVFGAEAARAMGLVREVVKPEELMPRVRAVAELIAKRAPLAVRAAKAVMTVGLGKEPEAHARLEQVAFGKLFDTKDMREGTRAFLDKRDPTFTAS